jgi:hypothetical protein
MTDVTGDAFLGMSMACCRCHDHKFDPLPQRDYFKLRAFFEPIIWRDDMVYATSQEQAAYDHQLELWQRATADIRERMDALLQPFYERKWASTVDKFPLDIQAAFFKPVHERSSWDQQMAYLVTRQFTEEGGGPLKDLKEDAKLKLAALEQELAAYDELKPLPLAKLMTATDFAGTISPTVIPDAAEPTPIEPGFITAISDFASADLMKKVQLSVSARRFVSTASAKHEQLPARTSGRRTALARWIGDANNPLTTRVIVNRIWQQHFGQGIVATPSDFGRNGTPPSHPELLDWLTVQFVADDWSFKQLHKRILMSSTWRQSADHPLASDHQSKDPSEQLLWRSRVRRLKAEQIRDSMLTLGGELDKTLGGPSVDESKPRRALYVQSFRNKTETFLHSFDLANGLQSVAERDATTTPVQALMLINGDYSLRSAAAMAQHVDKRAAGDSPAAACELALRLSWGRPPQQHELMAALQFVGASPGDESPGIEMDRLVDLCHVLLNSNEFLYIE